MIRGIRPHQSGFTILELIIVLTVSSALLFGALGLLNNKIPRTQFANSVNDLNVMIDDAMNQVAAGNYPSSQNFTCAFNDPLTPGSTDVGTNQECIFLGQAIQFGVAKGDCATSQPSPKYDCDTINFYTVYGNAKTAAGVTGKPTVKLSETNPRISEDYAQSLYTTGYGLSVEFVKQGGTHVGGVAYLKSFGSSLSSSGDATGSSSVFFMPLIGTQVGQSKNGFVSSLTPPIVSNTGFESPINKEVIICLISPAIKQYAIIKLGTNQSPTHSERQIYDKIGDWEAQGCTT